MEKSRLRRRRAGLGVGAAVLLWGCSWLGGGLPDYYGEERELVSLRTENLNFSHATLYAVRDTETTRIGIVPGQSSRTFRLPWPRSAVLQVEIRLDSGGDYTTPGRLVVSGDDLSLIIQPEVRNSVLR